MQRSRDFGVGTQPIIGIKEHIKHACGQGRAVDGIERERGFGGVVATISFQDQLAARVLTGAGHDVGDLHGGHEWIGEKLTGDVLKRELQG